MKRSSVKAKDLFPHGMTDKQFKFCVKYLETGFNLDRALDYAYNYGPLTRRALGYKVLQHPKIKLYLQEQIQKIMDKTNLTAAGVLSELSGILEDKEQKASDRIKAAGLLLNHLYHEEKKDAPKDPTSKQLTLDNMSEEEIKKTYLKLNKGLELPKADPGIFGYEEDAEDID